MTCLRNLSKLIVRNRTINIFRNSKIIYDQTVLSPFENVLFRSAVLTRLSILQFIFTSFFLIKMVNVLFIPFQKSLDWR